MFLRVRIGGGAGFDSRASARAAAFSRAILRPVDERFLGAPVANMTRSGSTENMSPAHENQQTMSDELVELSKQIWMALLSNQLLMGDVIKRLVAVDSTQAAFESISSMAAILDGLFYRFQS